MLGSAMGYCDYMSQYMLILLSQGYMLTTYLYNTHRHVIKYFIRLVKKQHAPINNKDMENMYNYYYKYYDCVPYGRVLLYINSNII